MITLNPRDWNGHVPGEVGNLPTSPADVDVTPAGVVELATELGRFLGRLDAKIDRLLAILDQAEPSPASEGNR